MASSSIEWTDKTWNPVAGCSLISPGCTNCYAMRLAFRLATMGEHHEDKYAGLTRKTGGQPKWTGEIRLDRAALDTPRRWRKPVKVFVNSMSDLFHEAVPVNYIEEVFTVIRETPRHTYQMLTKRADRLLELSPSLAWPDNLWMGVSIESEDYLWRADRLRQVGARSKFLSLEPLLGPLSNLDLGSIDWVIVGGESGPGARFMDPTWVRSIRDQVVDAGVAFFFKQWGGHWKKAAGRDLDGRTWDEFPSIANGISGQRDG